MLYQGNCCSEILQRLLYGLRAFGLLKPSICNTVQVTFISNQQSGIISDAFIFVEIQGLVSVIFSSTTNEGNVPYVCF